MKIKDIAMKKLNFVIALLCGISSQMALAQSSCQGLDKQAHTLIQEHQGVKQAVEIQKLANQCDSHQPLLALAEHYGRLGQEEKATRFYDAVLAFAEQAENPSDVKMQSYVSKAKLAMQRDDLCAANTAILQAQQQAANAGYKQQPKAISQVQWAMEKKRSASIVTADQIACLMEKTRSIGIAPRLNLTVNFAFDKSTLDQQGIRQVDELIQAIRSQPVKQLNIIGHTDLRGSEGYNQQLSEQRAQTVEAYIAQKLTAPGFHMQSTGKGESRPIMASDSDEAGAVNRRVEVAFAL
jgi:outer membrane protein OmpA-like peptidoglycan-associated protein